MIKSAASNSNVLKAKMGVAPRLWMWRVIFCACCLPYLTKSWMRPAFAGRRKILYRRADSLLAHSTVCCNSLRTMAFFFLATMVPSFLISSESAAFFFHFSLIFFIVT